MTSVSDCPVLHFTLTPDCPFEFKLFRYFSGSGINDGVVTPATATYTLGLCKEGVLFKKIECGAQSLGSVILGVPLKLVEDCHNLSVNVAAILADPSDYVIVESTSGAVLHLNIQVANGYLYIEITIVDGSGNSLIVFDGEDAPSLELVFSRFSLPLTRRFVGCECQSSCLPVVWLCGRQYVQTVV